jgi:hypothetical protein
MSDPNSSEAPLSPEARALIGRARRSFLFSIGLLLVGLLAVGGAIVYKSAQSSGSAPAVNGADYALAAVKVPSGAQVISAVAAGGQISVTYKNGTTTSIRIFDGKSGELIREVPVLGE